MGEELVFSDIPGDSTYAWYPRGTVRTFRVPSHQTNGNTLDPKGRIVSCEHAGRQVVRLNALHEWETLASHFEGKRLNSPNDAVFMKDGTLFFTDPAYGVKPEDREIPFTGVYRLHRGKLSVVARDMKTPNGIALSPDEKRLYVADTEAQAVYFFELRGQRLGRKKLFAKVAGENPWEGPDGLSIDASGRVYVAGSKGVEAFSPEGEHLLHFPTPKAATNCAVSPDSKRLAITAGGSVYLAAIPN